MRSIANSWFLHAWEKNPEIFEGFRREVAAHVEKREASGEKFNDFVAHMSELARIANGIAIEIGIADGTIPPDDVIADLLRMGAVKPQDLVDVDFDKLKSALNDIMTLAGQLEEDTKVTKHETRYLSLEKLRKSPISDITKVPGMTEYKQELTNFKYENPLKQTIESYASTATNLKNGIENVKQTKGNKETAKLNALFFVAFGEALNQVENNAKNFNDVTEAIAKLKKFEHANFLHVLLKEFEYTGEVIDQIVPNVVTKMENNFGKIEQSGNSIADNLPRIDNVLKLLATRVHPELIDQIVGHQDLDKLLQDTQSNLLSTALSSDGSRTLRQALEPLSLLKSKFETLDQSWKAATPTSAEPILEVLEDGKKLIEETKTISSDGKATIPKYEICVNFFPRIDSDGANGVKGEIDDLTKNIHKLSGFSYIEKFKNLTEYTSIFSDLDTTNPQYVDNVPGMVDRLNGLPTFDEMFRLFAKYDEDMKALKSFLEDYESSVSKIFPAASGELDTYLNSLKVWLDKITCLQQNVPEGEKLAKGIQLVQAIRRLKASDKVQKTENFVNSISKTTSDLAQLQKDVRDKKPSDEELAKIKLLENSKQVATKFGKAVNGLVEIRKVLDNESQLAALKNDASLVQSEADKFRNQLSTEDYQEIAKLGALDTEVDTLLAKLKAFKSEVENLAPTKISDNSQAFQSAAAVPSLVVSPKLKQAVKNLEALVLAPPQTNPPAPVDLQPMIKSLETLESMNLDFASYQFAAASGPLTSLETFFQDFTNSIQISAVGPGGQGPPAGTANGPRGLLGGEGTTAGSNALIYGLIAVICLVIVVFVGVAGWAIFYLKRKKDQKKAGVVLDEDAAFAMIRGVMRTIMKNMNPKSGHSMEPMNYFKKVQKDFEVGDMDDGRSKFYKEEFRHNGILCRMETAVKLNDFGDDSFIHANIMPLPKNEWILSQAPLAAGKLEGVTRKDTREKHWAMIEQKNVVLVMQLCKFIEREDVPGQPGEFLEKDKCAKYYSETIGETLTFGRYTVTTEISFSLDNKFADDVANYSGFRIRYKNTKTGTERTVDIVRYFGWPDHEVPEKPEIGYQIVEFLDTYENQGNVLIHCSAGVGRTGTVAAIKKGIENVNLGIRKPLFTLITDLRGVRLQSVQTSKQTMYVLLSITKYFMTKLNVAFLKEYSELCFIMTGDTELSANSFSGKESKYRFKREMTAYVDAEQKKVDPEGLEKRKVTEVAERAKVDAMDAKMKKEKSEMERSQRKRIAAIYDMVQAAKKEPEKEKAAADKKN